MDIGCSRDGRELLFEGFLKAYQVTEQKASAEEGAAGQVLPPLSDGEPLVLHGLFPEQHFTKPPPHFTEASLIKTLERLGIGRPSTYASIIRTIVKRGYVERQRKALLATGLGFVVCDFLVEQFPDLFAVGFTAQMEDDLDCIARGERRWVEVLREFYGPFAATVERAQGAALAAPVTVVAPAPATRSKGQRRSKSKKKAIPTGEKCPQCGGDVVIREGKYGRFRACANFPRCKWSASLGQG